jgi:type IV pilus assembly protein PilQ
MKSSLTFKTISKTIALIIFLLFANSCATTRSLAPSPEPNTPAQSAKASTIQRILSIEEEGYTRIRIEGSEPIAPPFYKLLSEPLRISIDIPNIDLGQIKEPIKIGNGTITEILTTQYDDKGRIEIGLVQMANYNITKEDKNLIIDVEKVKKVVEVVDSTPRTEEAKKDVDSNPREEEAVKGKEAEIPPTELKKEEVLPTVPVVYASPPVTVNKAKEIVNFLLEKKDDTITLKIIADGEIENYNSFKLDSPSRLVVDLLEVTTRYPQKSIKIKHPFIKEVRIGQHSGKVRLVFDSQKPRLPSYQINRIGDQLIVSIGNVPQPSEPQILLQKKPNEGISPREVKESSPEPPKSQPRTSEGLMKTAKANALTKETASTPKKEEVTAEPKKEEEKPIPEAKKEEKVLSLAEEKPVQQVTKTAAEEKKTEERKAVEETLSESKYTGRKLSLDFKDADVKNILRLIAEVSNLNIITGDEVTGKITMRLVEVPWDQALDVILQARSLGMIRAGNVIRIAPIDKLKKEVEEELIAKRSKEKLEDLMTELISVNYATAKELVSQVKSVLSDRGDVKIDDRTNILIVKDIPRNIIAVKNLVKSLDTKTPQVMIEARIIEANLNFQNDLGVSWGFLASTGTDKSKTLAVGGGNLGTTLGTVTNKVVDLPALPKKGTAGILEFLFTSKYGIKELDLAISAHENQGNVKIISSPKIATLDNKEASIEQGLRIPYRKYTAEGTATVDFIEANLKLIVTPHVTNDGYIKLNIRAKKDAPDTSITVDNTPSIDKKEAITEVLIKDSGVFVIAGIFTIDKNEEVEGIPLFSKIPLLGWLFKREAKAETRKDLMIFISPKIIKDEV